jgi:two-component system osmolarity sensor histidine kinase EnvZ
MGKDITSKIDILKDFKLIIKKNSLKRAIRNLVDNSFHYGDKVEISAKINRQALKIIVDDNGPGIPEDQRSEIFKPFYRIDNSRNLDNTGSGGGAGLGLSIVMDVISSHGGKIKVDDSSLGGLRIIILLPI